MRMFECDDLSSDECEWYKQRWHFWYEKSCSVSSYLIDTVPPGTSPIMSSRFRR
jgi:hypothetical protein